MQLNKEQLDMLKTYRDDMEKDSNLKRLKLIENESELQILRNQVERYEAEIEDLRTTIRAKAGGERSA